MKKAYVYFLVPLVGLALFGGLYWQFSSGYEKRLEEKAAVAKKNVEDKLLKEAHDREKAVNDALAAQTKRKAEKAAKEAQKAKEDEEREAATQVYRKTVTEADKLEVQVKRLTKELDDTKAEIAKIEEDKRRFVADAAFLKEYVKKAEANRASLTTVLEKIAAADKAAEDAAKAAAAAAAAKKS
jgi:serine phosphatase RsbU (regulator of sigma subunit)